MKINRRNIELLAPAGTFESFIAAIQSGADAVYLAGKNFGARTYAGNFDNEEIINAIEYAHLRGKKVYVVINTLIKDTEISDCLKFVQFLYHNDVDALIVQDIGLAKLIRQLFPDLEMHSSTQMSIANSLEVLYLKKIGFSRVVLARENSIEEINYIKSNTGMQLEAFAHGALCVSYSGKCLFSYINGGRSGNRGECAQPCRKKYQYNFSGKQEKNYLLSTKDLSTINQIRTLILNGVDSLKIEGRMKKPEYVATVVKSYRDVIDSVIYDKFIDMEKINFNLSNSFNRTFTKGFILNETPKNLVNNKNSKNIGMKIGTIIAKSKNKIRIKLEKSIKKGDGLDLGEYVGRIFLNGKLVDSAQEGDIIEIDYIGKAKVGDFVQKTSDKNLSDSINNILRQENIRIPVNFIFKAKRGEFPSLKIIDVDGNEIEHIEENIIVEESVKSPLKKEIVEEQLLKIQDTIFLVNEIDINVDNNSFLKKSSLNAIRRNVLKKLQNIRKNYYKRDYIHFDKEKVSKIYELKPDSPNEKHLNFSVKCLKKYQIDICKKIGINNIYVCDFENYFYSKSLGLNTFFSTPVVMKDNQIKELMNFIDNENPNILTNSFGFAEYINNKYKIMGLKKKIRLDYLTNIYNKFSIENFYYEDIDSINLSLEHNIFSDLSSTNISGFENKLEIPLYINPILMITEYCPYKTDIKCDKCKIDNKKIISEDKHNRAILKRDIFCRMEILSDKALDFRDKFLKFKELGINKFRVDLLDEKEEEIEKILVDIVGR